VRPSGSLALWAMASLGAFGRAEALAAQAEPRLVEAVRLAREGLGDSARAIAGRVLAVTAPTDPLFPEVLYTVAVVANEAEDKRLYLQRVAVEFSQSEWADDARLELAQLDYAERDLEGAVRNIDRLLGDYPLSPLRAKAALWGARAALDQRNALLACQWATGGLAEAGDDLELRNQLDYQRQRCQGLLESAAAQPPPPAAPVGPQWFVQVAAFRARSQADRVVATLTGMELTGAVVHEDGFFKVRAGPYPSRERAAAVLPAIRRAVGGSPFVVQVR